MLSDWASHCMYPRSSAENEAEQCLTHDVLLVIPRPLARTRALEHYNWSQLIEDLGFIKFH